MDYQRTTEDRLRGITMLSDQVEQLAETLAAKTKHYLVTTLGRVIEEANTDEVYRALALALREEVMINWLATARSRGQQDCRMLYYLSMEYLPGRLFLNNAVNLSALDLVKAAMHKLNCSFNEIAFCESDPGLGNGGLGRLASCFLDSLATQNYPVQAYGLRYQYGLFEQQLWNGQQVEAPDCWLIGENPWEFRRDLRKVTVQFSGKAHPSQNIHGDEIFTIDQGEEVWAVPYDFPIIGYSQQGNFSVVTLRLWTTKESPRNFQLQRYNAGFLDEASENTSLTDVLYPSDYHDIGRKIRLKQEFLLVSASLQDIIRHYLANHSNFRDFADKVRIQINDTHPTLVIPELIRIFIKEHDIPWQRAVEITKSCVGYTNHTILAEALEQWDQELFGRLLPSQYKVVQRLNHEFCNEIRLHFPGDESRVQRMSIIENGKVRMAHLAIFGSHSINGVAELHSQILRGQLFKDFYDLYPERFNNVTNGVSQRRWLLLCNPDLAKFLTRRIGDGWITDFAQIAQLAPFAEEAASQEEFLLIKDKNKSRLIDYLTNNNRLRDDQGNYTSSIPVIDPHSLFDVQIKRIHEYKRQLMNILHVVMLYHEMIDHPQHPRIKRTVIIGGKAAASYETAKTIIRFICCVARRINRDPALKGMLKVIYVENYNVSKAEYIIPAADLSEQISTAGMEASGTGNMKLAINGALTIGTEDGANIEMREAIGDEWWPFRFGSSAKELAELRTKGLYNPHAIYEANPKIKRAVDTLRDRTFATNDSEHQAFSDLCHKLHYGDAPDPFFTLKDLWEFYETQQRVETLYQDRSLWARYCLMNLAHMGKFSTDRSIDEYNRKIWQLQKAPPEAEILELVRFQYSEHDKCRIF